MHAGIEYTRRPNRSQIEFAHRAIDAGADLVIGTHPHWIQTLEKYHGRNIFYSLGNFIFDQRKTNTREGLVLRITVSRPQSEQAPSMRAEFDQIELIPVVIEHIGIPRKASQAESTAILKKIGITDVLIMPGRR